MVIKAYDENQKQQIQNTYLNAKLIAQFVNLCLNGKDIPPIADLFPSVAPEVDREKAEAFRRDQWIMFAEAHNKRWRQKAGEDL